ncbi:MAG: hypothetical protein ACNA8L_01880 [Luteolibacter sp.]|jgi:hypothetical protein
MPRFQTILIILIGLGIVALGLIALRTLGDDERFAMLNGCLTLGGALFIAGMFALRMPAHGIIGAGVVALLGAARGLANLPELAAFMIGDRPRAHAPLIETGVTILCLILLIHTMRWVFRERIRRMLEE